MSRLRFPFIRGTTTDNPLSDSATTFNSAELAGMGTVSSPDIAVVVLDPLGDNGTPEIVWVTAHTASASSATIIRSQEGTTNRSHPVGTDWIHGPTTGTDWVPMKEDGQLELQSYSDNLIEDNVSTTYTVDLDEGTVFRITLEGNVAFGFTNEHRVNMWTLILVQDGSGGRVPTFTGVLWPDGNTPTLSTSPNRMDIVSFIRVGSDVYGFLGGVNFS